MYITYTYIYITVCVCRYFQNITVKDLLHSIEINYFWDDNNIIATFTIIPSMHFYVFKMARLLLLLAQMRQNSTEAGRPSLIIFNSSQIQQFHVFQQELGIKKYI